MDGARVLMLEAGRRYDPATETPMMQTGADAPLRGAGTPEKPFGFWDATIDGGWQVPGEPYTSASEEPERQFQWWRARMLGGRTNHWGRISCRNGTYDFKPRCATGSGSTGPWATRNSRRITTRSGCSSASAAVMATRERAEVLGGVFLPRRSAHRRPAGEAARGASRHPVIPCIAR
jgi:choline dehydrogenase-like flavoprotein